MAEQLTIYDMHEREDARVELKQLPTLVSRAIRLILRAGRPEFLLSTGLQTFSGLAVAATRGKCSRSLGRMAQANPRWPNSWLGRFIARLPDGYDTLLGPEFVGGVDLSIGQWQRMALARAFFRDAPFVILDEPTAALDARAEHELFERIGTLLAGRTVLLISIGSHRSAPPTGSTCCTRDA